MHEHVVWGATSGHLFEEDARFLEIRQHELLGQRAVRLGYGSRRVAEGRPCPHQKGDMTHVGERRRVRQPFTSKRSMNGGDQLADPLTSPGRYAKAARPVPRR